MAIFLFANLPLHTNADKTENFTVHKMCGAQYRTMHLDGDSSPAAILLVRRLCPLDGSRASSPRLAIDPIAFNYVAQIFTHVNVVAYDIGQDL